MTAAASILAKSGGKRILVIGDIMLDHYLWGDATRISPEAPVPVIEVERDTWACGGAANVALNLASLGASCTLCGSLGVDATARRLTGLLGGHGIRVIANRTQAPTILKSRVMVQHQQLCRLDRESAPEAYRLARRTILGKIAAAIGVADAVVVSDYAKGVVTTELIASILDLTNRAGVFFALDPKPKRPLDFSGVDLITPNRKEALQLAKCVQPVHAPFPAEEVCAKIHALYRPKYLVITLGEDGMLLCEKGRVVEQIPTVAKEVFDVSGAGDTALAALTLALITGEGLRNAARFANLAAGVVVGKIGTATVAPAELLAAEAELKVRAATSRRHSASPGNHKDHV